MRLAIVAVNAYPAIEPQVGTRIGGLETFAWSLARALARDPAFQVQFVVRHTSRPPQRVVDGVELWCEVEPLRLVRQAVAGDVEFTARAPWLRIKRFRPSQLWQVPLLTLSKLTGHRVSHQMSLERLLPAAQPDVVLTLGASEATAAAVQVARAIGVPSWIWLQSNADLDERFFSDASYVDPYHVSSAFARDSLQADGIICQTQWQQNRVKELLGRDSVVIPNPVDAERFPVGEPTPANRKEVLWIGRYDRHHKRPHLALEVAQLCPGIPFHLIVNPGDPAVEQEIRSRCPPNVRLNGYVPRDLMPEVYRTSRLCLCTGSNAYEGFPNVLLEAAASGTPIVSLEEFDGFIERSNAGVNSMGDVARLAAKIRELWEMPPAWTAHSLTGAEYVRREHTLEQCVRRFREAINSPTINSPTINS